MLFKKSSNSNLKPLFPWPKTLVETDVNVLKFLLVIYVMKLKLKWHMWSKASGLGPWYPYDMINMKMNQHPVLTLNEASGQ